MSLFSILGEYLDLRRGRGGGRLEKTA